MNKSFLILGLLVCLTTSAFTQNNLEQKIEAQRVAFITQALSLTPEESANFWPIFNEFRQKEKALKQGMNPGKDFMLMSDAEVDAAIDNVLETELEIAQLKVQYFKRLKTVISARKLLRLSQVEQKFNREILKRIQQQRRNNRNDE